MRNFVLLFALIASMHGAQAAPKPFPPEKILDVARESALPNGRLFELGRLTVPICKDHLSWSTGTVAQYLVWPQGHKLAGNEQVRQIVMREFGVQAGEAVWMAEPVHTMDAKAGIRRGDRLRVFSDEVPQIEPMSPWRLLFSLGAIEERNEKWRLENNARRSRDPVQKFTVLRGDQVLPVEIESVPRCSFHFTLLDSEYKYAGASYATVLLTRPLLQVLDEPALVMTLAHEVSQIMLGYTELRNRNHLASSFLGALLNRKGRNADNHELGQNSADEDSLIQIDRLTAILIEPYGLTPLDFKRFLEQRLSDSSFFRLSYVRTRQVTPKRLEALIELDGHRRKEGRWLLPYPLEDEQFEALARHLAQAKEAGLISPLGSTRTTP